MCVWRMDAARSRQTVVGSRCVPNTAISSAGTPRCRSVAYDASAATPLPTIAQRMLEAEVHGVRPEEGARRRAPSLDPWLEPLRPLQMILRLLRKLARSC